MTKADIVNELSTAINRPKKELSELVDLLFHTMKETVVAGEELKIAGFGKFEVKQKDERRGRNPQTGEDMVIGARRILTFRASNILRERVNNDGESGGKA